MPLEIERKFLVAGDFKSLATSSSHIMQGYICCHGGRTVRIRKMDDLYILTIKGPSGLGGLTRLEIEKEVTPEEGKALFGICEPGIIEKIRYRVPIGKHICEVDEFFGENEGLIMAEIELNSEDEAYTKPSFLGEEVTGDRRYYNSQLRKNPYKNW